MAWKRLLGLLCFFMSFSLFGLIWLLNKQRAGYKRKEIAIYEVDVSHLSQDQKCKCAGMLVDMEGKILEGTDIAEDLNNFKNACFPLELYSTHSSSQELLSTFNTKGWQEVKTNSAVHQLLYAVIGLSTDVRNKQIEECKKALEAGNLELAMETIDRIPDFSIDQDCKAWKNKLERIISTKKLIRRAGCKLFCDD